MKKALAVFVGVIVFFSCQRSDPNPGNTFFTLTTNAQAIQLANSWIFATDKLGNVLDVQPGLGTIQLRSTMSVPDSINITLLTSSMGGSCRLSTYVGIPKNSILQESSNLPVPTKLQTGKATITISDYSENPNVGNLLTFSDGYSDIIGKYATDSHTGFETMTLLAGYDSILVSGYNDLTPVYRWFPRVVDGDQINASFSTFLTYPKTVAIDFDGVISGYVSGLTSDNPWGGLFFGNIFTFKSPAMIGYLDGYSRYSTYIRLNATSGATVVYEKTGTINPHVSLPAFDFKATDTMINNFQFTFAGDYTYNCVTWSNGTTTPSVTWQVYTSKTSIPGVVSVPAALSSRFPSLRLENLKYAGVDFIKLLDGSTFNDFAMKSLTTLGQQPVERITFSYH